MRVILKHLVKKVLHTNPKRAILTLPFGNLNNDEETTMEILNGVTFLYTNIQIPKKKYQSEATEWSVQCVVTKETAKAWNKRFKKQQAKVYDNDEFKEKFDIDVPFPKQEEQYVIKLSRDTHFKSGEALDPKYAPKVFQAIAKGKVKNITKEKLVSNGSTGQAAYDVVENDFGTFAKLNSINIEKLIEYVPQGGNPFGEEVESDEEVKQQAAFEEKSPPKQQQVVEDPEDDDSDESPF